MLRFIPLFFLLVACGAPAAGTTSTSVTEVAIAPAVSVVLPTDTAIPSRTPEATDTPEPTATEAPTATTKPTDEPTATPEPTAVPTPDPARHFGLNNLAVKESGGIRLEVARVVVADKSQVADIGFERAEKFNDYDTVVEILFRLTNTSDQKINVHPNQGTVIIGNEQINLTEWMFTAQIGDVGGEVFPGVTQVGGLWLGVARSKAEDITKMTIAIDGPVDEEYSKLGEDCYFEIDLSNHEFQEIPADLK